MKKHVMSFICGAIFSGLLIGLAIFALASSGKMSIEVDPINIMVDGRVFAPTDVNGSSVPVFAYNGTTYAPLRALAEAFGLNVGYDAAANMAMVTKPGTQTAPPVDTPRADIWEVTTYVDKFNESTDQWYIRPKEILTGTFSNSAAKNSKLEAKVFCDLYDDISIFLYEYGSIQVKNYSSSANKNYVITVRSDNREDVTVHGYIDPQGDRIFVNEKDVPLVLEILKGTGTVRFCIEEADPLGVPTTYLFSLETGDFVTEYQQAKQQ